MAKAILALGAHADDIDLQAGAMLAKYASGGYRVVYGVVTTSASGVPGASPDDAYSIRHAEARAAAKFYNAQSVFIDYQQCNYPAGSTVTLPNTLSIGHASRSSEAIGDLAKLIVHHKPEILLTHFTDDLHEDHYYTSILVYRAWTLACRSLTVAPRLWLWRNSHLGSVTGFYPNIAVEVSKEDVAAQRRAIKAHASQYQRTLWMHTFASGEARKCGKQFGYRFAQPFVELSIVANEMSSRRSVAIRSSQGGRWSVGS